jgi:hypothetical protein
MVFGLRQCMAALAVSDGPPDVQRSSERRALIGSIACDTACLQLYFVLHSHQRCSSAASIASAL